MAQIGWTFFGWGVLINMALASVFAVVLEAGVMKLRGRPLTVSRKGNSTWPFWDSNLKKRKDWKETCEICPGAGTGKLYSLEQIETERTKKSV